MTHFIRLTAKDDIFLQFRYYLLLGASGAAGRFLDASVGSLCQMPEMGAPKHTKNPVLTGLRSWAVQGFEDIRIYYVIQGDVLRVVRVLHGKRDINKILKKERVDETHH